MPETPSHDPPDACIDLIKANILCTKPDYSIPKIPTAQTPSKDALGNYNGYSTCESSHSSTKPTVPYGKQDPKSALATEQGFKSVRGALTEGRFLTFEMNNFALANHAKTTDAATSAHKNKSHRFVVHQSAPLSTIFTLSSALDGRYLSSNLTFVTGAKAAGQFKIVDLGNGSGYTVQTVSDNKYLSIDTKGNLSKGSKVSGFKVYSVSYSS